MEENIIGPVMPEHLTKDILSNVPKITQSSDSYGPQLPPNLLKFKKHETSINENNSEESDVIGPLPLGLGPTNAAQQALDERAEILKYNFLIQSADNSDTESKRESWMMELPSENTVHYGLGPRKFKLNNNGDKSNRSLWTETPKDKVKSGNIEQEDYFEMASIMQRNKTMDEAVKKSKKHKKEKKSLLEIYRQKLKKKEKDEKKDKTERRPFDRDVDLKTHRFNEAQKSAIMKKAQLLDNRFSAGKSKYL